MSSSDLLDPSAPTDPFGAPVAGLAGLPTVALDISLLTPVVIDSATGKSGLVAALHYPDSLTHVVADNPSWRAAAGPGDHIVYEAPLCRLSSQGLATTPLKSLMPLRIVGGHHRPTEPSIALAQAALACSRCARLLASAGPAPVAERQAQ